MSDSMKSNRMKDGVRLVITGGNQTEKKLVSLALSQATSIPLISSPSQEELFNSLFSGERIDGLNFSELTSIRLREMEERVQREMILYKNGGNFISEESVLSGQAYHSLSIKEAKGYKLKNLLKWQTYHSDKKSYEFYLQAFKCVAQLHAKEWYTDIIQLPEEHNSDLATNEVFRNIGFKPINIMSKGNERVDEIIQVLGLKQILASQEAFRQARMQMKIDLVSSAGDHR